MLVKSSNAGPEAQVIAVGVLAFSASKTLGAGTDRLIRVETTRVTGMNRPSSKKDATAANGSRSHDSGDIPRRPRIGARCFCRRRTFVLMCGLLLRQLCRSAERLDSSGKPSASAERA